MEREPPTLPPDRVQQPRSMDAPAMAEAFRIACRHMSGAVATVDGYRLFWVQGASVGWQDLPAGGAYAIVGSHDRCDAVLRGPGVALRHLLATTVELSDGLALRLLDLNTQMPFVLQDGSPQRSIVAAGSVLLRLGAAVLGGVPIEAGRAPDLPDPTPALPEIVVASSNRVPMSVRPGQLSGPPASAGGAAPKSSAPSPSLRHHDGGSVPRPPIEADQVPPSIRGAPVSLRGTAVTSLPPPQSVERMSSLPAPAPVVTTMRSKPPQPSAARRPLSDGSAPDPGASPSSMPRASPYRVPAERGPEGPPWAVTLRRELRAASVSLSDEDLSLGVVIGRSTSCIDKGLQAVLDAHISRGHVLLLHHHDAYEVFDLCSLNGTWEGGKVVKRRRLGAERATFQLAGGVPVELCWHGKGEAG